MCAAQSWEGLMLLELKQYLVDHPGCSVPELCRQFTTSAEVIRPMLTRLELSSGQRLLQTPCSSCESACKACPLKQLRSAAD